MPLGRIAIRSQPGPGAGNRSAASRASRTPAAEAPVRVSLSGLRPPDRDPDVEVVWTGGRERAGLAPRLVDLGRGAR